MLHPDLGLPLLFLSHPGCGTLLSQPKQDPDTDPAALTLNLGKIRDQDSLTSRSETEIVKGKGVSTITIIKCPHEEHCEMLVSKDRPLRLKLNTGAREKRLKEMQGNEALCVSCSLYLAGIVHTPPERERLRHC